jgi:hypothetical protein
MSKNKTENAGLKIFQMPAEIAQQTREQQALAPYCGLGFKKARLQPEVHSRMLKKLEECAPLFQAEEPIHVVKSSKSDVIPALYYEDHDFNAEMSKTLQASHEEWSGMQLLESACYGFRVYQRGTFLHNHVDITNTHIISSTICVDHRLDSPWPLYIEDIDGNQHQVDMEPGEMIFYEGARLIHGRPYVLNGDYYVGVFVHYRPSSFSLQWGQAQ